MKSEQLLLNFTNYLDGHHSSLATLERFAFSHGMAASGELIFMNFLLGHGIKEETLYKMVKITRTLMD